MRYLTVVKKPTGSTSSKRYRRKPYRKKTSKYGTSRLHRNKLMGSKHSGGKHYICRKAFTGITPSVKEPGASSDLGQDLIRNFQLKGAPRDGNGAFTYTWTLASFPNYTSLTGIYQFYRIKSVTICFYPEQNMYPGGRTDAQDVPYNATQGQKGTAPAIIYAVDRSSSALFSSVNSALEHEGSKMHVFNGPEELTITLRPTVLTTTGPSGSTVTVPGRPTWIPCTSTGVEHYGLRCFVSRMSDYVSLRIVMNMTVEFKDAKV